MESIEEESRTRPENKAEVLIQVQEGYTASLETPKNSDDEVDDQKKDMSEHLLALAFCRLDANRDLELDHQELRTYIKFCCPSVGTLNITDWYELIFEPLRAGLNLSNVPGRMERSLTLQQFEKLIFERQSFSATAKSLQQKGKMETAEFQTAQRSLNALSLPEGYGRKTIQDYLNSPEGEHDDDIGDGGRWQPSGYWITEKILLSRINECDLMTTVEERVLLGDILPSEEERITTTLPIKGIRYGWELTWKLTEELGCYVYILQDAAPLKLEERIRSWPNLSGTVFYRDGECREKTRNVFCIKQPDPQNILVRQRQWGRPPASMLYRKQKTDEESASATAGSSSSKAALMRGSGNQQFQQQQYPSGNTGSVKFFHQNKGFGFTTRDNGESDLFFGSKSVVSGPGHHPSAPVAGERVTFLVGWDWDRSSWKQVAYEVRKLAEGTPSQ
jgi:cold shock CspA family protein